MVTIGLMSILSRISFFQNRRDEEPNKELAKMLAETENNAGIAEIAANLGNKNRKVQSDCLAVLYHIGYEKPRLISEFVADFLLLLENKNNRLVWGSMIALSTIANLKPAEIFEKLATVKNAIDKGTVITVVWGVKTLAKVAAANPAYKPEILPILIAQLNNCIPRDVATHFESILPLIDDSNRTTFMEIIEKRKSKMTPSQLSRIVKLTKKL